MKTNFLLLILIVLSGFQVIAQIAPDKYYIQFTDKNNSPYSLDKPEEFLTQRALDRRDRQGIAIVENDIPVNTEYRAGVAAIEVTMLNATRWMNGVTIETDDSTKLVPIQELPYVENVLKMIELYNAWKKSIFES